MAVKSMQNCQHSRNPRPCWHAGMLAYCPISSRTCPRRHAALCGNRHSGCRGSCRRSGRGLLCRRRRRSLRSLLCGSDNGGGSCGGVGALLCCCHTRSTLTRTKRHLAGQIQVSKHCLCWLLARARWRGRPDQNVLLAPELCGSRCARCWQVACPLTRSQSWRRGTLALGAALACMSHSETKGGCGGLKGHARERQGSCWRQHLPWKVGGQCSPGCPLLSFRPLPRRLLCGCKAGLQS